MAQDAGYGDVGRTSTKGKKKSTSNAAAGAILGAAAGSRPSPPRNTGGGGTRRRTSSGGGGGGYGGGYGGGGGGGGLGSSRTGSIAPAAPKPPNLAAFLAGDSTYRQQQSALAKAKADYLAQQNQAKTQYMTGYASDLDTLKTNRTSSLADLENDYASRGLLQSGLYADTLATTNNDWDKRQSALDQARAAYLSGLTNDLTNFTEEQNLTLERAKQEAAARRASQYGL